MSFPISKTPNAWTKLFTESNVAPVIPHVDNDVTYIITAVFSSTCSSEILTGWSGHNGWLLMTVPGYALTEEVTIETKIPYDLTRFEVREKCPELSKMITLISFSIQEKGCGNCLVFRNRSKPKILHLAHFQETN